MTTIRRVTVAGIRGVRSPVTVDLTPHGLLLRGDNGTGKSSLVQGISLALTGQLGTPAGANLPPEFVRHHREKDDAKHVVIELAPRGRIELRGEKVTFDDEGHGEAFRDAARRSAPFLRRDELLRVVTQENTTRLRYFEGFLDLGPVERLESGLRERRLKLADSIRRRTHTIEQQLAGPARILGTDVSSTTALQNAVMGRARAAGVEVGAAPTWPEACAALRDFMQRGAALPGQREELARARARTDALVPPDHPAKLLGSLRAAEQKAAEGNLVELLEEALEIVKEDPELKTCPVCEQSVGRRALTKRLKERLGALQEVQEIRGRAQELAGEWGGFIKGLAEAEQAAFEECELDSVLLEDLAARAGLSRVMLARKKRVLAKLDTDLKRFPDQAATLAAEPLVRLVRAMGEDLGPLELEERELAREEDLLAKLHRIEKAVADARKTVVTRTLSGISGLVTKFYELIHPQTAGDEPTGAPQIRVTRHGKGTAMLLGTFDGAEVEDPRHVYSDGHLDTVGLCIFLALRRSRADREGNRDPKLMVLDDVVGSIDACHFGRLLEVLRDEFADHQIVLASHNELFMKMARMSLTNAKAMAIKSWSLNAGPRVVPHVSALDDLRAKLANSADVEEIARAMSAPLEPFLQDACHGFVVAVPYCHEDLTVADYWPPLRKKLSDLAKERILPRLDHLLNAIGELEFFRNSFGAHSNPQLLAGAALQPVERAATAFLQLVEALSCVACGAVVRLRNRRDKKAGLGCQCPNGAAPQLRCQNGTAQGVVES